MILKHVKELVGGGLVYGLSGMITSALMVFLVPIYTRLFSPAEYGVLNLVNTSYILLSLFVIFGLDNSAALWYWQTEHEADRKKTFASWAYYSFFVSSILSALIVLFAAPISVLLLKDDAYWPIIALAGTSLTFASLQKVSNIWFRVRKKPVWAVSLAVTISLTTIGLTLYLVVGRRFGIVGVYWAQLGGSIVGFVISLVLLRDWILPVHFRLKRLWEMLHFGAPLVPAALAFWGMNSAGGFFIQHYLGKTEVGLYQLGLSLSAVVGILLSGFIQAWSPFAFSITKDAGHREIYAEIFRLYIHWGGLAVMGMFLFSPEVVAIIAPPAYSGAAPVSGLLALNLVILNAAQIVAIGCAIAKTNTPYSKAVIVGAGVSVALFMVLIPYAGKEGAVAAAITGNLIVLIFVYRSAQKLYFVPYEFVQGILQLLGTLLVSFGLLTISNELPIQLSIIVRTSVFLLALGLVAYHTWRATGDSSYSGLATVSIDEEEDPDS